MVGSISFFCVFVVVDVECFSFPFLNRGQRGVYCTAVFDFFRHGQNLKRTRIRS